MPVDPDPNGPHLPKVLRDLVALSAVSSLWAGRDSQAVATDLSDLLATLLNLDFAFVRLCDSDGNCAVEVPRGAPAPPPLPTLPPSLTRPPPFSSPPLA